MKKQRGVDLRNLKVVVEQDLVVACLVYSDQGMWRGVPVFKITRFTKYIHLPDLPPGVAP